MRLSSLGRRQIRFSLLSILLTASTAFSQYRPAYPPAYYPGYRPYGGAGGVYAGQAELVKSAGQLMNDQEKARVEREKANQAKLDTQKQAFDQGLYEKAMKPTYVEDQKLVQNNIVTRVMQKPYKTEITNGTSLNIMMPYIRELSDKGISGPPIPINQTLLSQVNVVVGKGATNVGMLKDVHHLEWPIATQGKKQQQLDILIPQLTAQASSGQIMAKLYLQTTQILGELQAELRKKYQTGAIDARLYLNGQKFLNPLADAVRGLDDPGTRRLLQSSSRPKGSTVPELVYNMTSEGMTFAPANFGSEAPYFALQNAFVSYIRSAQSSSGFSPQLRPTLPSFLEPKQTSQK